MKPANIRASVAGRSLEHLDWPMVRCPLMGRRAEATTDGLIPALGSWLTECLLLERIPFHPIVRILV